jgi:hypothetical protein
MMQNDDANGRAWRSWGRDRGLGEEGLEKKGAVTWTMKRKVMME